MLRSTVLAILLLALPGGYALGQSIESPYDFIDRTMEVWAFGGAVLTDRGTLGTGPGPGPTAGLGFTVRISGPFNADARIAYLPTSRRVFDVVAADTAAIRQDPTVGLVEIGTADLSLLLADASLRFDITGPRTWHRLQPYALIGAGVAIGVTSENAAEEELPDGADLRVRFRNGVTGHIGAGVEFFLGDRFTIRADARDILWKIHVPEGFITSARLIDDEQWVQTAHLTLGLGLRF